MKKLIAMIGAVAMSFGLFAATPFSISFDEAEEAKGVDTEAMTFTPGEGWNGWAGGALAIKAYADGEVLPYGAAPNDRRNSAFDGSDDGNYLPLETGKNTLTRDVGEGNIYLDQLVKFTGFEEMQTEFAAGTKIAVWKASIADDDDAITNANLYVTVGKYDIDGNVTPVTLKLDGTYADDTWYRLTIKSLGNVFQSTGSCAGFVIYINGQQVASSDDDAKVLIENSDEMTATAKSYMLAGKLFTSMTADADFASIGYQGIGAIDDVILDAEGPLFAQVVDFDVTVPENFAVAVVSNLTKGVAITADPTSGKYTAGNGEQIGITVVANGPVVMNPTEITKAAISGTLAVTADDLKGKYEEADVSLARGGETAYFTKDGFEALLLTKGAVVDGDVITVLKAINKISGGKPVYSFTAGVTITIQDVKQGDVVTACKWLVYAPNYTAGGQSRGGAVTFNLGIEPEKQLEVSFEDETNGKLTFSGTIGGEGAYLKIVNGKQTLSGITLVGNAKVITKTQITKTSEVFTNEKIKEAQDGDFWVYSIKGETGFAIILADGTIEYFDTLDAAIAAAGTGDYPAVVTIMADAELTAQTLIQKNVTIDLGGKTLTYTGCDGIYFKGCTGTVENGTVTLVAPATDNRFGAIGFEDADGLVKDVIVNAGNAKDGVVCCSAGNDFNNKTVVCKNVNVTGAGRNFYAETAAMTLDEFCSATQTGAYAGGDVFCDALAAGWLGQLTVNGGIYTAEKNAVATMSSPATITLNDGTFTGALNIVPVDPKYVEMGDHNITKAADVVLAAPADYYWFDGTKLGKKSDAVAKIGDDELFLTLDAAIAAAEDLDLIELLADVTINADMTVNKDITLMLQDSDLVIADGKTLAIAGEVEVTRGNGGVQNLGSISVASDAELDMSTFGWGAGLIPAAGDETDGTFAIAGTVMFAEGTDPREMVAVNPGFFEGTAEGAKFIAGAAEYTYTDGEWKLPQTDPVAEVTIGGVTTQYADLHEALEAGAAKGSLVELIADVDLANKDWVPVASFQGSFDGKGYTISNLTITGIAPGTSSGAALIASSGNESTFRFQNVTFENVDINVPGAKSVAVVSGYCGGGMVSNVTVTGKINIVGMKYVGGIVGSSYITVVDCHVDGIDKSQSCFYAKLGSDDGAQIGGITGYNPGGNGTQIIGCSVMNLTIKADTKSAGGIAGRMLQDSAAVDCSVENVDVLTGDAEARGGTIIGESYVQDGNIRFYLNNTAKECTLSTIDGTPLEAQLYGTTAKDPSNKVVFGTDAEGYSAASHNTWKFTAGKFELSNVTLEAFNAYVADGYAAIDNGDGTYTIQAVYGITITPPTNGTLETSVTNGVLEGTTVTVTATPAEGYKLKAITLDGEDITDAKSFTMPAKNVTVAAEFEEDAADPIVPGQDEKTYTSKEEAEAAAANRVVVPTVTTDMSEADVKAFDALFTKTAVEVNPGVWEIKVDFTTEAAAALQPGVDAANVEIAAELSDTTKTEFTATIPAANVKPGLWYGIAAQEDVAGMANAQPAGDKWVQAKTAGALELPAVPKPSTAKGFFKVVCAPMPTPAN